MNKKTIFLMVGIIVVIIAFFVFNNYLTKETIELPEEVLAVDVISINNLLVPDQSAETEIFVEKVLFKSNDGGGFIVIRQDWVSTTTNTTVGTTTSTTTTKVAGDLMGVSRYVKSGVTDNLIVPLGEGVLIEEGDVLVAVMHADNGDGLWDEQKDMLLTDMDSVPISVSFTIMSQGDIDIGPKL